MACRSRCGRCALCGCRCLLLFKAELIYRAGPRRTIEDVELATLAGVDWHNHRRLHGHCRNVPPANASASSFLAHMLTSTWTALLPFSANMPGFSAGSFLSLDTTATCELVYPDERPGRIQ